MADEPTTAHSALSKVARRWWLVLLVLLLAASGTYLLSSAESRVVTGVINTRAVLELPNDRLDLIEDLQVAVRQSAVLSEPAAAANLSVAQLRDGLAVERVGNSNLVSVSLRAGGDRAEVERTLVDVVDAAADFLSGTTGDTDDTTTDDGLPTDDGAVSPAVTAAIASARTAEAAASDAVAQALIDNGGISPLVERRALERIDEDDADAPTSLEVETAVEEARNYEQLVADLDRARSALTTLTDLAFEEQATNANARLELPVAIQAPEGTGALDSARLRRALVAGLAAALLTALVIPFTGRGPARRQPPQPHSSV